MYTDRNHHVHAHICIYNVYMKYSAYTHIHICTCTHTHVNTFTHVYTRTHCLYVYINAYAHIHIYVCVYINICIHMYIHTIHACTCEHIYKMWCHMYVCDLDLNPQGFATWTDEDFVGRVSRISRRKHVFTTAARTLSTALMQYRRQFNQAFSAKF